MRPRAVVLRAAGTNCDAEAQFAWQSAGADCEIVHLNRIIDSPAALNEYDIVTLPGGFSFGDDISAGRIFATRLIDHLGEALRAFVDRGGLVLGICNGFQVLAKAGLLTADAAGTPVTLACNESGFFSCRWTTMECTSNHCLFLDPGRRYFLPIAHGEGRVAVPAGAELDEDRVALRFVDGPRRVGPVNPNGSAANAAGLTDPTGRILGLMPHPERFIDPTQHPFWTAAPDAIEPDGLAVFRRAIDRLE